jgi:hypothetical protein
VRETTSDTRHCARHTRALVLAVTCCALATAACGSSSKSTTTAGSSRLAASLKFSVCMRSHGVPNFPDPTSNGPNPTARPVDKRTPAFHAAQQTCQSLQAALADFKPRPSRAVQLSQAECMRAHGVPNYPDPLPDGRFRIPSTINPQSPTFTAAANICAKL